MDGFIWTPTFRHKTDARQVVSIGQLTCPVNSNTRRLTIFQSLISFSPDRPLVSFLTRIMAVTHAATGLTWLDIIAGSDVAVWVRSVDTYIPVCSDRTQDTCLLTCIHSPRSLLVRGVFVKERQSYPRHPFEALFHLTTTLLVHACLEDDPNPFVLSSVRLCLIKPSSISSYL